MAETLTVQQRAAVENRGGNLLVSAAAGSGKTKVLVERLFRYVAEEGRNLDDFLIITYTKAAAAELRGKIAAELSRRLGQSLGDRHLRSQLLRVYQADIKTVDAFCTALLRENTHLLAEGDGSRALTPDFRVLDDSEAVLLRERILRRTLEAFYESLTPGGELLADTLGAGRDDRKLSELALEVYEKLQSHAWPERWLSSSRQVWAALSEPDADGGTDSGTGTDGGGTAEGGTEGSGSEEHGSVKPDSDNPARFDETPWAAELLAVVRRRARYVAETLREKAAALDEDPDFAKGYGTRFRTAADSLEPLARAQRWEDARNALELVTFPRLGVIRGRGQEPLALSAKSVWALCKKNLDVPCDLLSVDGAEAMEDLRAMAPAMTALLDLVGQFAENYRQEKLRLNAADFSDQEHLALKLLVDADGGPAELGRQTAERYVEILVDEYQDTNEVQNAIFRAVSRNGRNLFTVGDVKQSIYRFRLAEPGIFLEKYGRFKHWQEAEPGEERKILLSRNFRSRREILDAANFVFANILSPEMGEMDYGAEEALYFGAAYYPERTGCETEFHLLADGVSPGGGEDNPEEELLPVRRTAAEARFTAGRIRRLLDEGFPVTGSDGTLRPCRPDDIVILMRSPGARGAAFYEALAEAGVPCSFQRDEGFFETMETATVLSLLEIVDNPRQDVPLISVLRSPAFGFTPDRLAEIRAARKDGDYYDALRADAGFPDTDTLPDTETLSGTDSLPDTDAQLGTDALPDAETLPGTDAQPDTDSPGGTPPGHPDSAAFLRTLAALREAAQDMGVSRFLWHLYDTLNLPGVFGAMDGGEERRENLLTLTQYAERFEQGGWRGVFAFVTQLRRLLAAGQAPEGGSGGNGAGVRLMSIHKSKGLEFPIVVLADLSRQFSRRDYDASVLVHPSLGLGPERVDLSRRIRYPTLARLAVRERLQRENLAEEQRILYVAMTRPKEKLILVHTPRNAASNIRDWAAMTGLPVPPETVAGGKCFGDWLLMTLLPRPEAEPLLRYAGVERPEGFAPPADAVPADGNGTGKVTEPDTGSDAEADGTPYLWGGLPWRVFLHDREAFRDAPAVTTETRRETLAASFDPALLTWTYPYTRETATPAKVTATQLKGRALDDEIAENAVHTPRVRPLSQPKFRWEAHGLTPAERGTAVHLALQYLDFHDADVSGQLTRMRERNLLTAEQAAAVDVNALVRFLRSPIAEEIRRGTNVLREYPFTLLLDAAAYDPAASSGDRILLQGVVDCCFETAAGITVVDFKTDRISGPAVLAERKARYLPQLRAYSDALERVWGKPVVRRVLFFLDTGEAVDV